jgi:hypothetical protein
VTSHFSEERWLGDATRASVVSHSFRTAFYTGQTALCSPVLNLSSQCKGYRLRGLDASSISYSLLSEGIIIFLKIIFIETHVEDMNLTNESRLCIKVL